MLKLVDRLIARVDVALVWLAAAGGIVILIQMVWITYGVFTRYVLNDPSRMVTEATALLLFPVAFAGLAYALREDAYPKVTMLIDNLPARLRKGVTVLNFVIMLGVGLFLSIAGVYATLGAYESGASSEILLWPRWAFWLPVAVSILIFTVYTALRLMRVWLTPAEEV